MTGHDDIKATERWLDLRKRLAIKYLDSLQVIIVGMEAGEQMDITTFRVMKDMTEYCDKVFLTTKEPN